MKKLFIALTLATSVSIGLSSKALAIDYQWSDAPSDYSDATDYEAAWHFEQTWQKLGTAWDKETAPKDIDTSDDGVSWSLDGGSTYGHDEIYAGQSVDFKFDMYKNTWGGHSLDLLKVWIDWDQDYSFDEKDVVLYEEWDFTLEDGYTKGMYAANISKSFYLNLIIPDEFTDPTSLWMRARVVCDADISAVGSFDSTGYLQQGEVEDYQLTVAPIPEPSTFLLFISGIMGLSWYNRKRRKHITNK